jgi:hypothetical protein
MPGASRIILWPKIVRGVSSFLTRNPKQACVLSAGTRPLNLYRLFITFATFHPQFT